MEPREDKVGGRREGSQIQILYLYLGSRDAPDVVGHVEAAQEGHVLLAARGEAAGGVGVAQAAQVAVLLM